MRKEKNNVWGEEILWYSSVKIEIICEKFRIQIFLNLINFTTFKLSLNNLKTKKKSLNYVKLDE